jgi:hypothetical protein
MRRVILVVCVALASGLTGCGSGNPWDTVDVSGKITYDDGSIIPVSSMKLYFAPQTPPADEKTFPRQGSVGVNAADGSFEKITTYKHGDGLIPGKHKVVVAAYDGGRDLSPKVPKEYTTAATTPLEIDTADSPLAIKIRRP